MEAGADILVHSIEDKAVEPALIQRLKACHIPYITTFMVHEGYREVLGQEVELSPIEQRRGDPQKPRLGALALEQHQRAIHD
ncbi:hypothetical protein E3U44_11025 [Nitrosococcus wardiae]|uniref:Uncharacterized protein n=1 Tax=Nitrosococcus wardiae TaxID=1814290 RepID=A0A4V1AW08_9GAMM|nr:hypothetical protein E3U44_11025 [Nitrosococcus wardiae]